MPLNLVRQVGHAIAIRRSSKIRSSVTSNDLSFGTIVAAPQEARLSCRVEIVAGSEMQAWREPWADLAQRCLEPDIFLSPAFALPALQWLGEAAETKFVLAFREAGNAPARLIGLLPLRRTHMNRLGALATWRHDNACIGGLMLDREHAADALAALLGSLARAPIRACALILRDVPAGSPTAALIRSHASATGLPLKIHGRRKRAMFDGRSPEGHQAQAGMTSHRRKRLRQQHRKLEKLGALHYEVGTDADRAALGDTFLRLEAAGWKGTTGGALLGTSDRAAFARSLFKTLPPGECRVDALRLDGRPIAMGVVLRRGDRAWLWKMTYDEAFASASPGVQFIFGFMKAQSQDETVSWTDSCAVPDHRMIERLWPERLEVLDIMLGLPGRAGAFRRTASIIAAARALRGVLRARAG